MIRRGLDGVVIILSLDPSDDAASESSGTIPEQPVGRHDPQIVQGPGLGIRTPTPTHEPRTPKLQVSLQECLVWKIEINGALERLRPLDARRPVDFESVPFGIEEVDR